jgi:hypothetical protein
VFCRQVARIIEAHRLDVEKKKALEFLVHFDQRVIESASCDFSAYSKRDGFDERKRHFAYFVGIVKNKQKEVDKARRESAADVLRTERLLDEKAVHDHEVKEERRQENRDLEIRPDRVIIKYAGLLMQGRFRLLRKTCLSRIRDGLVAFQRLGKASPQIVEILTLKIRSLPYFAEDLKDRMVKLLSEEMEKVTTCQS